VVETYIKSISSWVFLLDHLIFCTLIPKKNTKMTLRLIQLTWLGESNFCEMLSVYVTQHRKWSFIFLATTYFWILCKLYLFLHWKFYQKVSLHLVEVYFLFERWGWGYWIREKSWVNEIVFLYTLETEQWNNSIDSTFFFILTVKLERTSWFLYPVSNIFGKNETVLLLRVNSNFS